jgi:hypothetical protein
MPTPSGSQNEAHEYAQRLPPEILRLPYRSVAHARLWCLLVVAGLAAVARFGTLKTTLTVPAVVTTSASGRPQVTAIAPSDQSPLLAVGAKCRFLGDAKTPPVPGLLVASYQQRSLGPDEVPAALYERQARVSPSGTPVLKILATPAAGDTQDGSRAALRPGDTGRLEIVGPPQPMIFILIPQLRGVFAPGTS